MRDGTESLDTGRGAPPVETAYPGLCTTCRHATTCALPRRIETAKVHCEEFAVADSPSALRRPEVRPEAAEVVIGLCPNCENRPSCTYARPESGVWHCEEYR